ncbi:hypothetical protein HU200_027340 [Digitaria exilis]|uniref:Bifunctional inhibitor/plant lipid transfer protein/seed storage helical domain-containing protein n=1 Tax=Digitaria exilis TaxID=1010633 RepID=A0A835ETC2_9POAL|nr:hypothetical protein HU200_027340 [Digitaria exilis]
MHLTGQLAPSHQPTSAAPLCYKSHPCFPTRTSLSHSERSSPTPQRTEPPPPSNPSEREAPPMERPIHRLALLLGLLAFTAAAAATGARAQPACEPSNLATQITLFCMPDMPTAPCCEPVVASVDLGGGVPCLCRVAAQPQLVLARLNASHLLALYTACGGLRTGGANLAAACQGNMTPAPPSRSPSLDLRVCLRVWRLGGFLRAYARLFGLRIHAALRFRQDQPVSLCPFDFLGLKKRRPSPPATVPIIAPPPVAPRHKQPALVAPPPPPTSEKPSPSPQQPPGAAAAHGKAIPASPAVTPAMPLAPASPTPPTSGSDMGDHSSCTLTILFLCTAPAAPPRPAANHCRCLI